MIANTALYVILNLLFVLAAAPLLLGLIKKVKALMQGRRGPSLMQQYRQLRKLFSKEIIYSDDASFITRISPYLNIAFMLVAALFVPMLFIPQADYFSNIILFFYLMITARFFMVLGGLDAGSTSAAWELTGDDAFVSHRACYHHGLRRAGFCAEDNQYSRMFGTLLAGLVFSYPTLILVGLSLFIILIVESARVPVDNPETHLELTMIHEAMLLEQSGPKLALMELSSGVKQVALMALLINITFPWGLAGEAGIASIMVAALSMILKMGFLAITVGVFESLLAKIRLFRLPDFFILSFFLSFITIVFEMLL
jgi:formate hydrogenlyase subunit 4